MMFPDKTMTLRFHRPGGCRWRKLRIHANMKVDLFLLVWCAATAGAQVPAEAKSAASKPAEVQELRKKYPWYQGELFDESRRDLLEAALAGPLKKDHEIVFCPPRLTTAAIRPIPTRSMRSTGSRSRTSRRSPTPPAA